jgi:myo-inositol-1(or 4)-monophosphatase
MSSALHGLSEIALLAVAEKAADEARLIATDFMRDAQVISSNFKDIKTKADLAMNECIIQQLETTGIPVLSEEVETAGTDLPDECWIIDPLDGTFNFSRGYPCSGISIALWKNNRSVLGVVKNIFNGDNFSTLGAQGCFLNGQPVTASVTAFVKDAVLATGFPSGANYQTEHLLSFIKNVQSFKKVRAIGSASIMLSYVAQGIFDVYYENDIYLWDVAAGIALVEAAGGKVYYKAKPDSFKYEVLASNAPLFDESLRLLTGK